jgi:DNA helicase-2/ATP-dependent DNA helicase PcrA
VLNLVDGCVPSDMATGTADEIEEERRLLYVAMTRAKHTLQLVVPQRFYVHQQTPGGDRHVYAQRSRFLPEELLGLFDIATWPEAPPGGDPRVPGSRSTDHQFALDVAARLRRRWE